MQTLAKNIFNAAKSHRSSIATLLAKLVSIPSLSGQEKNVVDCIHAEMQAAGFDDIRIDGLGSIIGRIGSGKHIIAMDAHIDTVDVGNQSLWSFDPFNGHIRDDKVWGRGCADQKGGMAAMIYAGRLIKEMGLENDITLYVTGTVMEEDCDGLCWHYLISEENIRPDICIITEPTGLNIYRGQRGRMEISVSVEGLSAHGSAPERGDNAIYKMMPIVNQIAKLNENLAVDDFLGKGSVVISEIGSVGPSQCAVPDECHIYLDRRLTAGESKDSAIAEIEKIAKSSDAKITIPTYKEPGYTGRVYPMEKYYPSWVTPEDHPVTQAANHTYQALFNDQPLIDKWTFSTNGVAISGLHNIPCIGFGPGFEEQAHAPDEWTPVDHLWKACAFYTLFPECYVQKIASSSKK